MAQLNLGIIGNCQISALVDSRAEIVWCCMPRLDSPAVFASILDAQRGGGWRIGPPEESEERWSSRQHYLRNTNVLATVFRGPDDEEFEVIDFIPRFERSHEHYRPPQLSRIVRPLRGTPRIQVRCEPRFFYGRDEPTRVETGNELHFSEPNQGQKLYLSTDAPVSFLSQARPFELKKSHHFVLSYGERFQGSVPFKTEEELERTLCYWRGWAKHCSIPFEFQSEVLRSALTLKLHIFEDTGAIIAATTTSIPESPEGGRTWDYRYCWLRDAYFVVMALNRLGQFDEMEHFIGYLQNLAAAEPSGVLQPVYGIDGEKELVEKELTWLSGFNGIGPVRIGNAAYEMDQHDVYGEMVMAISPAFFDRRWDRTDPDQALKNVHQLIQQAIRCFDEPDAGIWEFRGEKQHSVFSKVMIWSAIDRGIRIADCMGRQDWVEHWMPIRDQMRGRIEKSGFNSLVGYFTQSYGGDSPDAANLLLAEIGFLPYQDERIKKTIEAYERTLLTQYGVHRYRTPDDFGVPKNTFTICSFWMVDALWGVGRKDEARALFRAVVQQANPLGLLSEDLDPDQGELWGNFPQTYSHVGLIQSAWKISRPWEDIF